jgi:hypothetical protein
MRNLAFKTLVRRKRRRESGGERQPLIDRSVREEERERESGGERDSQQI